MESDEIRDINSQYLIVFGTDAFQSIQKLDSNSSGLMSSSPCCLLLQVPKLIEGREYIIRIMAQNIYGISDPLLSAETKARDIFSKP